MQKICGISVKNGQKLKTLLRVEIERKLTKKTFFGPKNIFLFVVFLEILKFQNRIFCDFWFSIILVLVSTRQTKYFLSLKCAIGPRKQIRGP